MLSLIYYGWVCISSHASQFVRSTCEWLCSFANIGYVVAKCKKTYTSWRITGRLKWSECIRYNIIIAEVKGRLFWEEIMSEVVIKIMREFVKNSWTSEVDGTLWDAAVVSWSVGQWVNKWSIERVVSFSRTAVCLTLVTFQVGRRWRNATCCT